MRSSGNGTVLLCRTLQVSWLEVQLPRKLAASVCTDTAESPRRWPFQALQLCPRSLNRFPVCLSRRGFPRTTAHCCYPRSLGSQGLSRAIQPLSLERRGQSAPGSARPIWLPRRETVYCLFPSSMPCQLHPALTPSCTMMFPNGTEANTVTRQSLCFLTSDLIKYQREQKLSTVSNMLNTMSQN